MPSFSRPSGNTVAAPVGIVLAPAGVDQYIAAHTPAQFLRIIAWTALAAGTVAVLELASFVSGFGSVAEFSTSKVGVIHSDDTTPTDITDGTLSPAVPVKSLYQPVAEPRLQYSMTRQSKSVALSSKSTGERRSCP